MKINKKEESTESGYDTNATNDVKQNLAPRASIGKTSISITSCRSLSLGELSEFVQKEFNYIDSGVSNCILSNASKLQLAYKYITPVIDEIIGHATTYTSSEFKHKLENKDPICAISYSQYSRAFRASEILNEVNDDLNLNSEYNYYPMQQVVVNTVTAYHIDELTQNAIDVADRIYIDRDLMKQLIDLHELVTDTMIRLKDKGETPKPQNTVKNQNINPQPKQIDLNKNEDTENNIFFDNTMAYNTGVSSTVDKTKPENITNNQDELLDSELQRLKLMFDELSLAVDTLKNNQNQTQLKPKIDDKELSPIYTNLTAEENQLLRTQNDIIEYLKELNKMKDLLSQIDNPELTIDPFNEENKPCCALKFYYPHIHAKLNGIAVIIKMNQKTIDVLTADPVKQEDIPPKVNPVHSLTTVTSLDQLTAPSTPAAYTPHITDEVQLLNASVEQPETSNFDNVFNQVDILEYSSIHNILESAKIKRNSKRRSTQNSIIQKDFDEEVCVDTSKNKGNQQTNTMQSTPYNKSLDKEVCCNPKICATQVMKIIKQQLEYVIGEASSNTRIPDKLSTTAIKSDSSIVYINKDNGVENKCKEAGCNPQGNCKFHECNTNTKSTEYNSEAVERFVDVLPSTKSVENSCKIFPGCSKFAENECTGAMCNIKESELQNINYNAPAIENNYHSVECNTDNTLPENIGYCEKRNCKNLNKQIPSNPVITDPVRKSQNQESSTNDILNNEYTNTSYTNYPFAEEEIYSKDVAISSPIINKASKECETNTFTKPKCDKCENPGCYTIQKKIVKQKEAIIVEEISPFVKCRNQNCSTKIIGVYENKESGTMPYTQRAIEYNIPEMVHAPTINCENRGCCAALNKTKQIQINENVQYTDCSNLADNNHAVTTISRNQGSTTNERNMSDEQLESYVTQQFVTLSKTNKTVLQKLNKQKTGNTSMKFIDTECITEFADITKEIVFKPPSDDFQNDQNVDVHEEPMTFAPTYQNQNKPPIAECDNTIQTWPAPKSVKLCNKDICEKIYNKSLADTDETIKTLSDGDTLELRGARSVIDKISNLSITKQRSIFESEKKNAKGCRQCVCVKNKQQSTKILNEFQTKTAKIYSAGIEIDTDSHAYEDYSNVRVPIIDKVDFEDPCCQCAKERSRINSKTLNNKFDELLQYDSFEVVKENYESAHELVCVNSVIGKISNLSIKKQRSIFESQQQNKEGCKACVCVKNKHQSYTKKINEINTKTEPTNSDSIETDADLHGKSKVVPLFNGISDSTIHNKEDHSNNNIDIHYKVEKLEDPCCYCAKKEKIKSSKVTKIKNKSDKLDAQDLAQINNTDKVTAIKSEDLMITDLHNSNIALKPIKCYSEVIISDPKNCNVKLCDTNCESTIKEATTCEKYNQIDNVIKKQNVLLLSTVGGGQPLDQQTKKTKACRCSTLKSGTKQSRSNKSLALCVNRKSAKHSESRKSVKPAKQTNSKKSIKTGTSEKSLALCVSKKTKNNTPSQKSIKTTMKSKACQCDSKLIKQETVTMKSIKPLTSKRSEEIVKKKLKPYAESDISVINGSSNETESEIELTSYLHNNIKNTIRNDESVESYIEESRYKSYKTGGKKSIKPTASNKSLNATTSTMKQSQKNNCGCRERWKAKQLAIRMENEKAARQSIKKAFRKSEKKSVKETGSRKSLKETASKKSLKETASRKSLKSDHKKSIKDTASKKSIKETASKKSIKSKQSAKSIKSEKEEKRKKMKEVQSILRMPGTTKPELTHKEDQKFEFKTKVSVREIERKPTPSEEVVQYTTNHRVTTTQYCSSKFGNTVFKCDKYLNMEVSDDSLDTLDIQDSEPSLPYTVNRKSLPNINVCPAMRVGVNTLKLCMQCETITHPRPSIKQKLKSIGIDNIVRSSKPAKCCRKAVINEKPDEARPFHASLNSLPLTDSDLKVILNAAKFENRCMNNHFIQIYQSKFEYYTNFQENFASNIDYFIPKQQVYEVRYFEFLKKEDEEDGKHKKTSDSTPLTTSPNNQNNYRSETKPWQFKLSDLMRKFSHSCETTNNLSDQSQKSVHNKKCQTFNARKRLHDVHIYKPSSKSLPVNAFNDCTLPTSSPGVYNNIPCNTTLIDCNQPSTSKDSYPLTNSKQLDTSADNSSLSPKNYAETLNAVYELDENGNIRVKRGIKDDILEDNNKQPTIEQTIVYDINKTRINIPTNNVVTTFNPSNPSNLGTIYEIEEKNIQKDKEISPEIKKTLQHETFYDYVNTPKVSLSFQKFMETDEAKRIFKKSNVNIKDFLEIFLQMRKTGATTSVPQTTCEQIGNNTKIKGKSSSKTPPRSITQNERKLGKHKIGRPLSIVTNPTSLRQSVCTKHGDKEKSSSSKRSISENKHDRKLDKNKNDQLHLSDVNPVEPQSMCAQIGNNATISKNMPRSISSSKPDNKCSKNKIDQPNFQSSVVVPQCFQCAQIANNIDSQNLKLNVKSSSRNPSRIISGNDRKFEKNVQPHSSEEYCNDNKYAGKRKSKIPTKSNSFKTQSDSSSNYSIPSSPSVNLNVKLQSNSIFKRTISRPLNADSKLEMVPKNSQPNVEAGMCSDNILCNSLCDTHSSKINKKSKLKNQPSLGTEPSILNIKKTNAKHKSIHSLELMSAEDGPGYISVLHPICGCPEVSIFIPCYCDELSETEIKQRELTPSAVRRLKTDDTGHHFVLPKSCRTSSIMRNESIVEGFTHSKESHKYNCVNASPSQYNGTCSKNNTHEIHFSISRIEKSKKY